MVGYVSVDLVGISSATTRGQQLIIELRYDANVGVGVTCEPGDATHTSTTGHSPHTSVPREDSPDARFPPSVGNGPRSALVI